MYDVLSIRRANPIEEMVTSSGVELVYYWLLSFIGEYKLDYVLEYKTKGLVKYEKNKQVYSFEKEKIQVYEDIDATGKKIFRCYRTYRVLQQ